MKDHFKNIFLARWLNDDLTIQEESKFKSSEDYEYLKKIADLSEKLKTPDFDKDKTFTEILAKKDYETKVRTIPLYWAYKIAATILILFGIFYLLNPSKTTYKTEIGEKSTILLPDGSEVVLNSNTMVSYYTKDWDTDKKVFLKGEGFFTVKKGSLFSVATNEGTIQVLGTQFNVNSQKNYLDIQCFEGKVKVKSQNKDVILTKGRAYRIENNIGQLSTFMDSKPKWIDGESTFNKVPLPHVLNALKNEFGISFIYKKENYDHEYYTGSFIHDDLDTSLQMVLSAMGITYKKKGNKVFLNKKEK